MKLKDYLIKHRLSARGLAEIAHCSYSTIYRLLHGKTCSSLNALKIEKATNEAVTMEDLIYDCNEVKEFLGDKDE